MRNCFIARDRGLQGTDFGHGETETVTCRSVFIFCKTRDKNLFTDAYAFYCKLTNSMELNTTREATRGPAFHGTRRFNTEFTTALHLFLSRARPIHSTSSHPTSPRSILILSTHLRLGLLSRLFLCPNFDLHSGDKIATYT
jgi:hypothetical protein